MKAACRALSGQRRAIHSAYGGFKNQGSGDIPSMMQWGKCRGSHNTHFKEVESLTSFTPQGRVLASAIRHDTERLLASDWTTDYSGFWGDQMASHEAQLHNLYEGGNNPIISLFTTISKFSPEEKATIVKDLNYLKSAHKWAEETQRIYTEIFDQRFVMQRQIYDATKREEILAGCTELCVKFSESVPAEFRRKATKDLEWHLWNLRHWVWDSPATKAAFPIMMN